MNLARYLVCVDRGKWLPEHFQVHHVDNDIKNDALENLKVVTKEEHDIISAIERIEKTPRVEILCDGCNDSFERRLFDVRSNLNNKKTKSNDVFCSRLCRYPYISKYGRNNIKYKKLITQKCIIPNNNLDIPDKWYYGQE